MSIRYQIVCDACGDRKFVKSILDLKNGAPEDWFSDVGFRWHACSKSCKHVVDKKHAEEDGRLILWNR